MFEPAIANALTVDVEDYLQIAVFSPQVPRSDWTSRECRLERNVDRVLQLLADNDITATFFTLGCIADRCPQLVRRISDNRHEIASRGYGHLPGDGLSSEAFFADIHLAKLLLEDLCGEEVKGYRGPDVLMVEKRPWVLDCLERAGYRYNSSTYQFHCRRLNTSDDACPGRRVENMLEIPTTSFRLINRSLSTGGGWFRLLPYAMSRWMMRRVNRQAKKPVVFFFRPWEIDAEQPRIPEIDWRSHFCHRFNVSRMARRLDQLFSDFSWNRVDRIFLNHGREEANCGRQEL